MKAVRLNEAAGVQALHVEEIDAPQPSCGEVLVRVERAAFNHRDVFVAQNLYPNVSLPCTLGSDGAGHVAALGDGVAGPSVGSAVVVNPELAWRSGERVPPHGSVILGMPHDGTFADYVAVPAENVYPKPAPLSFEEAAAIPLAGLTAYRALFTRGRITRDDVVLITGVGGGVQTFVLLFAKYAGARTIVTSGSPEKVERARSLGADVALDYRADSQWHKAARAAAGDGGPTLVIDSAGGETLSRCLEIARPGARVVTYGGTLGDATIRPFSIFWKHLDVLGTSMGSPDDFRAMLTLFESGLHPVIDRVFAIDEAAAAARRMLDGEQFGKIVLAIA